MNDFDSLSELSLETIRGATVFAATFPILLVYPFLQKYFVARRDGRSRQAIRMKTLILPDPI
jgi:hypothetical protein